jgi:Cd2+/Zn2+-exporting ATPase
MSAAPAVFTELAIGELHCPTCAAGIERQLLQLGGVTGCQVNFTAGRIGVRYDPDQVTLSQLEATLERIGHPVRRRPAEREPASRLTPERLRLFATGLAGFWMALGFGLSWAGAPSSFGIACYALSLVSGGFFIARSAWSALSIRRTADINVLVMVAAVGAAAIGEWAEAASVLFLFSVAVALEAYSLDRTRQAVRALMELAPDEAAVVRGGHEATVPVEEVHAGETILIRPGGRVPLDGEVTAGRSSVNEAAITGEGMAVAKGPGDAVYAGTLNEAGCLTVRVTQAAENTTLARIVALIEEAQSRRSSTEQFVDRFARYYTPGILGLAVLLTAAAPLLGGDVRTWFYRALTLMLIACPCALVISTPVAIVCGMARAAREGVLIKGGVYLERLGSLKALAFDKTGTLTDGRARVADIVPLDNLQPDELLALAASAEDGSEHAVGRAVVHAAHDRGLTIAPAREFQAIPGVGVRAEAAGVPLAVGKPDWLRQLGYDTAPVQSRIAALQAQGKTVILVAREAGEPRFDRAADSGRGRAPGLVGLIGITDGARAEGAAAVRALKALGIDRIAMLTGDNPATARAVAAEIGIDEYYAELMPADKVARVQRLRAEAGDVAMVGDGINDAPALAAATVGIAMGAAGTDVALETADVALMGDDLSRLPFAVRLSRQTVAIIRQNIVFSVLLKAAFIGLTLSGGASLWLAVLADTGTSVLVVLNSLRLMRARDAA